MTKISSNRRIAEAAGFSILEGAYQNASDDCLGRWYVQHTSQDFIDKRGAGYATQEDAWAAAAEIVEWHGGQPITTEE